MITNKITPISQPQIKSQLIDSASRYNHSNLIYYGDFNIITFETYERIQFKNQPTKHYVITQGTEYKPWLVSQVAFNDPRYWWFIMEYNNIFDIEDFSAGKTIKIPSATEILQ